ncbi:MAG: polyisoprenoid-binding protein [Rhodobiaceae bacterium]|nr:MAG: polyisoprenoid-binding protein [Rhodobiaceae bacterium]
MFFRALIATLMMSGSAFAREWTLTPDTSTLSFSGTQAGAPFEGQFESFAADIVFDPDALEAAEITVTIDTASARSGSSERDGALPGSDWFDVAAHPTASFVAANIQTTEEGYVANGTLTLKGTTQDVALPFSLSIEGDAAHVMGALTIDRNDYGVGTGALSPMVGSDVTIHFDINATR